MAKELLVIVFVCDKFNQYIFGRSDVIVQSYHERLQSILKKPISAVLRLQLRREKSLLIKAQGDKRDHFGASVTRRAQHMF